MTKGTFEKLLEARINELEEKTRRLRKASGVAPGVFAAIDKKLVEATRLYMDAEKDMSLVEEDLQEAKKALFKEENRLSCAEKRLVDARRALTAVLREEWALLPVEPRLMQLLCRIKNSRIGKIFARGGTDDVQKLVELTNRGYVSARSNDLKTKTTSSGSRVICFSLTPVGERKVAEFLERTGPKKAAKVSDKKKRRKGVR